MMLLNIETMKKNVLENLQFCLKGGGWSHRDLIICYIDEFVLMEFIITIKVYNNMITLCQGVQKPLYLKCVLSVFVLNELTLLDLTGDLCLYNRFTKS